ncbi:hypothetical protein CEXT_410791 [Caerostris extrusa]|uniref:Uncharacterized protein n=1 Tax=Caerostris extrusa TaxID=172846 RepID=A0AAV4RCD6_CAEEX|nr:hypothetical protein CEXT_410791 [Caerostris extrusa]
MAQDRQRKEILNDELLTSVMKNSDIPQYVRMLAMETIHSIPRSSLMIYTDGSRVLLLIVILHLEKLICKSHVLIKLVKNV